MILYLINNISLIKNKLFHTYLGYHKKSSYFINLLFFYFLNYD